MGAPERLVARLRLAIHRYPRLFAVEALDLYALTGDAFHPRLAGLLEVAEALGGGAFFALGTEADEHDYDCRRPAALVSRAGLRTTARDFETN